MIREGRLLTESDGYFLTEFSFGIEQEEMDEMLHDLMEILSYASDRAPRERYWCVCRNQKVVSQKWKTGDVCCVTEGASLADLIRANNV